MLKIKRIIILVIPILLLCGCDNRNCIKSHEEKRTCIMTQCMPIGKTMHCITYPYSCMKTICDEYEKVGDK